jgi:hypothetical protein
MHSVEMVCPLIQKVMENEKNEPTRTETNLTALIQKRNVDS